MNDPYAAWIELQEESLKVQRAQIEALSRWSSASSDAVRMQKSASAATKAGLKALEAALTFWGFRR